MRLEQSWTLPLTAFITTWFSFVRVASYFSLFPLGLPVKFLYNFSKKILKWFFPSPRLPLHHTPLKHFSVSFMCISWLGSHWRKSMSDFILYMQYDFNSWIRVLNSNKSHDSTKGWVRDMHVVSKFGCRGFLEKDKTVLLLLHSLAHVGSSLSKQTFSTPRLI